MGLLGRMSLLLSQLPQKHHWQEFCFMTLILEGLL
uniref:Uncharacterized protein n=1 Tax=Arundo donax TaxID=35708 RepID=A0A0A9EAH7_ARUDO